MMEVTFGKAVSLYVVGQSENHPEMLVGHDAECQRILWFSPRVALQVIQLNDDTVLSCMLMPAWGR